MSIYLDNDGDEVHNQLREIIIHNSNRENSPTEEKSSLIKEVTEFEKKIDVCFTNLQSILQKVKQIEQDERYTVRNDLRRKMYDDLLSSSKEFYVNTTKIKQEIVNLQESNIPKSIKVNLTNRYNIKLSNMFNEFMKEVETTKEDFHQSDRKRIKAININLPEEKINQIVEYGQTDEFIKQIMLSDNIYDAVDFIEKRHIEILKIETNVQELYELFKDLSVLVDLQGESLNNIENNINKATDYVNEGEDELKTAEKYQKKAITSSKCLCLTLVVILFIIVLGALIPRLLHVY
jgi:syntaxin 1B/2/3